METLWQDVKYGARMLLKHRGVTLIAVLTLALGIGANTTVFTMLKGILLRPLPGVRGADELAVVLTTSRSGEQWPMNYFDYKDLRDHNDVLSGIAGSFPVPLTIGSGEKAERVWGEIVTGNMFELLGVRPALGRLLTVDDDKIPGGHPVAVISDSLWRRKFGGDPGIIGKPMQVGTVSMTVTGVTEREYRGSMVGLSLHVFVPMMMQREALPLGNLIESNARDNHWLLTLARRKPGVTFEQARAAVRGFGQQLDREYPDPIILDRALLVPLSKSPYGSQSVLFPVFSVAMIVAGVVLLVACANLSNIMLARATVRRQEVAVRLALGAGRRRLIRQLLTESVLLSLLGGAAALLVSLWAGDHFSGLKIPSPYPVVLEARFDVLVFGFALLVSALSGIIFGLAPAWQSSKVALAPALQDARSSAQFRKSWLRTGLLVGQVAVSLALLVCATLMIQTRANVERVNPGFDSENVNLFGFDLRQSGYDAKSGRAFYRDVLERVAALPGVESASLAAQLPLLVVGMPSRGASVEGYVPQKNEDMNFGYNMVSAGYFENMRIALREGRFFDSRDNETAPKVVIVSEPFARRYWPGTSAVGRILTTNGEARQVVGVVKEVKYLRLTEEPRPYIYLPLEQNYTGQVTLHVRAHGDAASAQTAVQRAIHGLDAALPVFDVRTLRQHMAFSLGTYRLATQFLSVAGLQALFLAAIGIYGVIAFSVAQRTREIGIRMALGAQPGQVLRLVMGQGFALALAGVALGVAIALASTRILASLLYGIGARDPLTIIAVASGLLVVALAACWVPARRAMRVSPLVALRYE